MVLEWTNEVEDCRIEGWMVGDQGALHSSPRLYRMFAILVCRCQVEPRRNHHRSRFHETADLVRHLVDGTDW